MKNMWLINYLIVILIGWTILTLIVQLPNPKKQINLGIKKAPQKALIVYHPDLFYNFDEQISNSFAEGLASKNWKATVATVSAAQSNTIDFDLYVFCANTYNFAPDWKIEKFIKNKNIENKSIVNITLGAGSTERSKQIMDDLVLKKNANLINSKEYWLMKPNDDNRTKESNIKVALEMAKKLGITTANNLEEIVQVAE